MKAATRVGARLALPAAAVSGTLTRVGTLRVLGWHRVDKRGDRLSTSLDDFREHLDVLAAWGANVLQLDEAVRLLAAGALPERAVALTFDDGYASVAEIAWPELAARAWPATLFVVTDYLDGDRVFPWDLEHGDVETIRLLDRRGLLDVAADGLDIGSHTVSHAWLPSLRTSELDAELRRSRLELADLLGRPVSALAYPTGGWNADVRAAARRAGYGVAVTTYPGRNRPGHDPLALRRAFAFDRASDFRLQLTGAFDWTRPIDWWHARKGPSW